MATTSTIEYLGALRTRNTHQKSGSEICTDAPVDNNGKGEAFSPTDLVATAAANCMLTVIGIAAEKEGFDIVGATCTVEKKMIANPRRIGEIRIDLKFPQDHDLLIQSRIKEKALNCPVVMSLHPNIRLLTSFSYGEETKTH